MDPCDANTDSRKCFNSNDIDKFIRKSLFELKDMKRFISKESFREKFALGVGAKKRNTRDGDANVTSNGGRKNKINEDPFDVQKSRDDGEKETLFKEII